MSKVDEIVKRWKDGEKQVDIAMSLGIGESYVSQVLGPLKNPTPIRTFVPREIKRLFDRINRNVEKTWGFDNKQGREKHKPKYRNLYEDWEAFKEWLENL